MRRVRVLRSAIVVKPSTLLHLQSVIRKRKYRMLFSPGCRRRPGPKGPTKDLTDAVEAMKRRQEERHFSQGKFAAVGPTASIFYGHPFPLPNRTSSSWLGAESHGYRRSPRGRQRRPIIHSITRAPNQTTRRPRLIHWDFDLAAPGSYNLTSE